jgi:hypothetical protein
MEAVMRQLIALDGPVMKVDAPAKALHLRHQASVASRVPAGIREALGQRNIRRRHQDKAVVDGRNGSLE